VFFFKGQVGVLGFGGGGFFGERGGGGGGGMVLWTSRLLRSFEIYVRRRGLKPLVTNSVDVPRPLIPFCVQCSTFKRDL